MDTPITPRDATETRTLGIGARISTALGIVIGMATTLLAVFGDTQWITDHLPLLGTGLAALVTGGGASFIAIRRMRIDKLAKSLGGKASAVLCLLASGLILSGCAVIHGAAGDSSYSGWAFGEKASTALAGLNITETQSEGGRAVTERGVGVDKSGSEGEADIGKLLGNLLLLGLKAKGIPVDDAVVTDTASEASESVAPAATSVTPIKPVTKKAKTKTSKVPAESAVSSTSVVATMIAQAKKTGQPLIVVAGSPTCGFCKTLDDAFDADAAFLARTDIIFYRDTEAWASNASLAWTGGGAAPIVRVTRWNSEGKIVCDKVLKRPQTVAAVTAAVDACTAPASK